MKQHLLRSVTFAATFDLAASWAAAQQALVIRLLAERQVAELPPDQAFWRIENFGSAEQAKAAASPWSVVAQSDGKIWLFTLGAAGSASSNGTKIAEVGSIPRVNPNRYLVRINDANGG